MAEGGHSFSIADASTPNAGRIYDYLLGGDHNFEIDRTAADQLLKDVPEMTLWVRLIRWFLAEATERLVKEGFAKFLDFASGLPTVDHIHQTAPKGTKVVYSDIDPVTVAYAQDIVAGLPDVVYVHGDAGSPESVLKLPVIDKLFGSDRKVAIGYNGIAWFLSDDRLRHALQILYDWAAPGSRLFLCDTNISVVTPTTRRMEEFYSKVKEPVQQRNEERIRSLFGNWTICEPGLRPLEEWIPIERQRVEKATAIGGGNLVGVILSKER